MAKGHELPRGVQGQAPPSPKKFFRNEYALRCSLVHFETQFEKCHSVRTDLASS